MSNKHVIIVGAGPAGLTAAAELCERSFEVTVLEKDPQYVGGLARTAHYDRTQRHAQVQQPGPLDDDRSAGC
jgi:protoporphyrinogen oxidase